MILYLDSSALVKLFVTEPGSIYVQREVAGAAAVVTHLIAYVEVRGTLARAVRMNRISAADLDGLVLEFERYWGAMEVVAVTESLIRRAGRLAQTHGLRGYDSMHLAAVLGLREVVGTGVELRFGVFDSKLRDAALDQGIALMPACRSEDPQPEALGAGGIAAA